MDAAAEPTTVSAHIGYFRMGWSSVAGGSTSTLKLVGLCFRSREKSAKSVDLLRIQA
jgi:hypothetical protein